MTAPRAASCDESGAATLRSVDRYLLRLKQMVPTLRGQTKVKKLELLQHVIDYIQDLELLLADSDSQTASPTKINIPVSLMVAIFLFFFDHLRSTLEYS